MDQHTGLDKKQATCTVILAIQNTDGTGSIELQLGESYDECFNKLAPLTPPTSALEQRAALHHVLADGRRVCFQAGAVALLTEDENE